MPRPRTLPDADKLAKLVNAGMSYEEIANAYGVSKAGVYVALRRSNLIRQPRPRYSEEIPWKLSTEHSNSYTAGMLRAAAKLRHGGRIRPEFKEQYVRNWVARLEREGLVIDYDPEVGFTEVPREGTDDWLIRKPVESV